MEHYKLINIILWESKKRKREEQKKIMAENFLNLGREMSMHSHNAQRTKIVSTQGKLL